MTSIARAFVVSAFILIAGVVVRAQDAPAETSRVVRLDGVPAEVTSASFERFLEAGESDSPEPREWRFEYPDPGLEVRLRFQVK